MFVYIIYLHITYHIILNMYREGNIEMYRNISSTDQNLLPKSTNCTRLNVHLSATCHKLPKVLAGPKKTASIVLKKSTIDSVLALGGN